MVNLILKLRIKLDPILFIRSLVFEIYAMFMCVCVCMPERTRKFSIIGLEISAHRILLLKSIFKGKVSL